MLKRTRPALWFSLIMILWAISTIIMGFVKTYPQLLALRAILGFFEGGLYVPLLPLSSLHSLILNQLPRCQLLHHDLVSSP